MVNFNEGRQACLVYLISSWREKLSERFLKNWNVLWQVAGIQRMTGYLYHKLHYSIIWVLHLHFIQLQLADDKVVHIMSMILLLLWVSLEEFLCKGALWLRVWMKQITCESLVLYGPVSQTGLRPGLFNWWPAGPIRPANHLHPAQGRVSRLHVHLELFLH